MIDAPYAPPTSRLTLSQQETFTPVTKTKILSGVTSALVVALLTINALGMLGVQLPSPHLFLPISNIVLGSATLGISIFSTRRYADKRFHITALVSFVALVTLSVLCLKGVLSPHHFAASIFSSSGLSLACTAIVLCCGKNKTKEQKWEIVATIITVALIILNSLGYFGVLHGLTGKLVLGIGNGVLISGLSTAHYLSWGDRQIPTWTKGMLAIQLIATPILLSIGMKVPLSLSIVSGTLLLANEGIPYIDSAKNGMDSIDTMYPRHLPFDPTPPIPRTAS